MKKHGIGFVLYICVLVLFTSTAFAETKVASEAVFMREGPGTQYKIILELQPNDAVEVICQSGNWTQVKFNGYTGYVFGKYLNDEAFVPVKARVAVNHLSVRAGAGTKYKKIRELQQNDLVTVISMSGKWARLDTSIYGDFQYVHSDYLVFGQRFTQLDHASILSAAVHGSEYYLEHINEFLGVYIDNNGARLAIRVSKKADIKEITNYLTKLLKGLPGEFTVVRTTMPDYVDLDYLDRMMTEMGNKLVNLTPEQQKRCPFSHMGYDSQLDRLAVYIVDLNDTKMELYKKWIGDWEYIVFKSQPAGIDMPKI